MPSIPRLSRSLSWKLSSQEFSGEHNRDGFMDWLIKVECVFESKHYKDSKHMQLTETKLKNEQCTGGEMYKLQKIKLACHESTSGVI